MVFVKYRERLEFAVAYFDERLGSLWLGRDFVGICTTDFLLKTECLYNFSSKWRKISSNLVIDTEVQLKFGKTKLIYSESQWLFCSSLPLSNEKNMQQTNSTTWSLMCGSQHKHRKDY